MSSTSDSDSSGPSPAVIGACSAVGGIIFIFVLVRIGFCVRRRRSHTPVPLPPTRPLTTLHEMPWNASKANFSTQSLEPTGYHPELLMAQEKDVHGRGRNVYRQYSGSTLATSEESPLRQPPSPITPYSAAFADGQLVPPQPSFFSAPAGGISNRSSAQVSVISSTESDLASYPPQRHQSVMAFPTDPLTADPSISQPVTSSPSSSPRLGSPRIRPLSTTVSMSSVQTARTQRSTRSLSTIRGAPHRSHSRVEIVLPAPLAQQTRPYMNASDSYETSETDSSSNRQSVCDPWLKVGREGTGPSSGAPQFSKEKARRSRTSSSDMQTASKRGSSRPSVSSLSSITTSANSSALDTSRSSSVTSHTNSVKPKTSLDMSRLPPPVPRVPSMYSNSPSPSPVNVSASNSITGIASLSPKMNAAKGKDDPSLGAQKSDTIEEGESISVE